VCAKGHYRPSRAFAVNTTHSWRCCRLQEGVQCLLEASCSKSCQIKNDVSVTANHRLQAGFWYNKTPTQRTASNHTSQNATKSKTVWISLTKPPPLLLSSSISHVLYIFLIFLTFLPHFCQADILPFDLNSNNHIPSSNYHPLPKNSNNNYDSEPSEIVIFHRWIQSSSSLNDFKLIENSRKDEHFLIDQTFNSTNNLIHFQCKAFLHSYFSDENETILLPVSWVTDDGKILSKSDLLQISKPKNELKIRCKADLKNLDGMIDGSLLSRSIYFSKKPYNFVKIKPEKIHTIPGSIVRFVCHYDIQIEQTTTASNIIWKHNNTVIKPSKLFKIGTIEGKSVLHILSALPEHSGSYQCASVNSSSIFESEASEVIIDEFGNKTEGIQLPSTLSAPLNGKMMFECLLPGTQGVRWILERRSYEKKGETLPRIESKVLGNGTILILKDITTKYHGNIKCIIEISNNSLITKETEFKVFNESFTYASSVYTEIERKQGTPVSFRCETYDILGEIPEMAQWSLDGKPIEKTPNIKINYSTDYGIGHADLIIGIAEAENEGLYTCIISNEQHERIHQLLLQVEITTNETIENLIVTTDHEKSCVRLRFDLPPSTDLSWAHFTPFFVVIYETNSTKSLNSLPLMAKCNFSLRCRMEICQSSGMLEDATEYNFRISMVQSGSGTVITPLSKPYIATTWDSMAKRSLPLIISYNETENSVIIKWDIPMDVKGSVEKFAIQILDYSEKMSNLFSNSSPSYFERSRNDRKFEIFNVSDPFAYKIRITPITRKDKLPSAQMALFEFFPFILFTSEQAMTPTDTKIPIPIFNLSQINRESTVNISWNLPDESLNISKILIKYQHVAISQAKFISIERSINEKSTELTKGIEVGFVYQVCAAFIRKFENFGQSAWSCQTIPVKNENNGLIFTTLKEALKKKQLPPAVNCENGKCRCLPSKINEGGLRVEWNEPPPRRSDIEDLEKQKPSIGYTVHYTFNETDPSSKEHEFPANDGDLFAELPPLLPNTSYRIMIETQNELKDKVDGTFFTCHTPASSPLPPPKNFYYDFINVTHLRFTWTPFPNGEQSSKFSGYTIYWQADYKPILPIFIPGPSSSSYIIGGIRPEPLYQAYIVSRSIKFKDSSAKSPRLSIRMPPDLVAAFEDMEKTSTRAPSFYRDPDVVLTFFIVTIITVSTLAFLCISCCLYFWCCLPYWRRKKRERIEALARAHSNASSKLSLDSDENGGEELTTIETVEIPLLNIPPDPPNFAENLYLHDTKGPPGGPRPLGNRRFRQMLHDETFKQVLHELNRDPTGYGLPPGTRDDCYRHIQCEEDQKFHELVEKEKREMETRRTGKKQRKPIKISNIAETSFIEAPTITTPNPSLHDDTYSEDERSQKYPASISMTELNRPAEGLSPRSHSIAIYRRFFPRKRPTIISGAKKALMEIQPPSSQHHQQHQIKSNELKPDSNNHHFHQRLLMMNSPSSLPNLADSGIVFDDLSTSGGTTTSTLNPCLPTIQQGSCSGSTTLVEDVLPKKSHPMLNQHLQDCCATLVP
jgi:hypothetical protein